RLVGAQAADRLQAAAQRLRLYRDCLDRQLHFTAGRTTRALGGGVVATAGQSQRSDKHESSKQQGATHGGASSISCTGQFSRPPGGLFPCRKSVRNSGRFALAFFGNDLQWN